MGQWHLVYCRPKQEMRAQENLSRQGFTVFRPLMTSIKNKKGGQQAIKSESLFPRYLFLKVDPEQQSIAPVSSTLGVIGMVRFGKGYAIAPESLINEIKHNVTVRHTAILADGPQNMLKKGDSITVDGHGFDHIRAIYNCACGDQRAIILMNILGQVSTVKVPLKCLSKCA